MTKWTVSWEYELDGEFLPAELAAEAPTMLDAVFLAATMTGGLPSRPRRNVRCVPPVDVAPESAHPRVYTRRGRVAHLLHVHGSPNEGGAALCGLYVAPWGDFWLGTGSQAERDRAASLPLCTRCA